MRRYRTLWALRVYCLIGSALVLWPRCNSAQEPKLTEAQAQQIKTIQTRAEKQAAPLALELAATAKRIYENLLGEKEDEKLRLALEKRLQRIGARLLAIKGQSIRDMVRLLTREQKDLLREEMRKPGAPADLSELIAKLFKAPESPDR